MSPVLHNYLVVGAVLFVLGAIGFLTRRNLFVMVLSAEMMLQGVALNLVAFSHSHGNLRGQSFIVFLLTVAACEAAVALALVLTLYQAKRTLDVDVWQLLGEPEPPPIAPPQPPEIAAYAPPKKPSHWETERAHAAVESGHHGHHH